MPHWKEMTERDYMFAFDLKGRDVTVTIDRIEAGSVVGTGGKKNKKPLAHFREGQSRKPLVLSATNCKTIAAMYGNETDNWHGKRITLYPTTTQFGGETVECIRVRPQVPTDARRNARPAAEQPAEQPNPDDDGR
jgi:hypothetical protein